jgi:hypothetical protein
MLHGNSMALRYAARQPAAARKYSVLCLPGTYSSARGAHTRDWVPILLSPLVAFAPVGDRKMGTRESSG